MSTTRRGLVVAALAGVLALGCGGTTGTITIRVVGPRDPALLASVVRLRATLGDEAIEATRGDDGTLALDLEVVAEGDFAAVSLEGFDEGGARVAVGRSAPLPIAAIDAEIAIFLGPPGQLAVIEPTLDPARADPGIAAIAYGALIAGGATDDGPIADVAVYDIYRHELVPGLPLPVARSGLSVMSSRGSRYAYLFGGADDGGAPAGDLWRFDIDAAPAGAYDPLASDPSLARVGADAVSVGSEIFIIGGATGASLHGAATSLAALSSDVPLDGRLADLGGGGALAAGAGVGSSGGALVALAYDGAAGTIVDTVTELDAGGLARTGHAAVALGDRAVVLGGELEGVLTADALEVTADGEVTALGALLTTPRRDAAVAASGSALLVAGGADDDGLVADAELLVDLEPTAILPARPRRGARAIPLATGQILVLGGVDEDGAPVADLELWTPAE